MTSRMGIAEYSSGTTEFDLPNPSPTQWSFNHCDCSSFLALLTARFLSHGTKFALQNTEPWSQQRWSNDQWTPVLLGGIMEHLALDLKRKQRMRKHTLQYLVLKIYQEDSLHCRKVLEVLSFRSGVERNYKPWANGSSKTLHQELHLLSIIV